MTYLSRYVALTILVSPFAMADAVLDKLSICAKNDDSLQRLLCYDKLAEKTHNGQFKEQKTQPQTLVQVTTDETIDNTAVIQQKVHSPPELVQPNQAIKPQTSQPKLAVSESNIISQQQAIFGHENKRSNENLIDHIKAKIVMVEKGRYGSQTITLVNGQVWRQTDSTRLRLKKDHVIIIKRAAMGSFFISKENSNKRIRAKRVK